MRNEIFTVIDDISINITTNGKTIDISKMLLTLELYESIFEFFLHGKLIIADTLDLPHNFPIVGNEDLQINISTTDSDKTINLDFKIYKLNKDTQNTRGDIKKKILILYFTSSEAIQDKLTTVSKKFNSKPENIVQDILTNNLLSTKTLSSETTTDSVITYSNFWRPSRVIDFVSKLSKTSDFSDYIFFENFDGFVFKPISILLQQPKIHDVIYNTSNDSFIGNANIKIFTFDKYFDILLNSKSGLFGSTYYKPNQTEYSYKKVESNFSENIEYITTLGSSSFFKDELSTSTNQVNVNYYEPDISKIRTTSIKLLNNYNVIAKLNGDFSRKSGDILDINFPNYDNESNINENFDGNWFILGIKHTITQLNIYEQNLLICKNAFFNKNTLPNITSNKNI